MNDKMNDIVKEINSSNHRQRHPARPAKISAAGWLGWVIAAALIIYLFLNSDLYRGLYSIRPASNLNFPQPATPQLAQASIATAQGHYIDLRTISTYDFLEEYRRRLRQDTNDPLIQREIATWQQLDAAAKQGKADSLKYDLLYSFADSLCYEADNDRLKEFKQLKLQWIGVLNGSMANTEDWLKKHAMILCGNLRTTP